MLYVCTGMRFMLTRVNRSYQLGEILTALALTAGKHRELVWYVCPYYEVDPSRFIHAAPLCALMRFAQCFTTLRS